MSEYEWVTKKEYRPVKNELELIIRKVIKIMRDSYNMPGIRYQLIGSGSRHLVTRVKGGNKGFDLDYNLILPTAEKRYNPKVVANQFMNAFITACEGTSYEPPKSRTSVIKLKNTDSKNSKIRHGGDFAIIYYDSEENEGYWYLKHLNDNSYRFEKRRQSRNADWKLEAILEYNNEEAWNWIREEYLKLKNRNRDNNKRSYILYLETVHNVYNQIQQVNPAIEEEQSPIKFVGIPAILRR